MDPNGYPDDEELKKIEEWDYRDLNGLMDFVKARWKYAEDGYWEEVPGIGDNTGKTVYEISTGGWSGNEDLIGALMDNKMFWMLCWYLSARGGHYTFMVSQPSEAN